MTATCLNTNGIEAVLRICCCAAGSIVFHGRKTTALSLTVSTNVKLTSSGRSVKGRRREAAIESLAQLAKAATKEELQNAFTSHVKETDRQSARLEKVFRSVGESVRGKKSHGIIGIVEEAKTAIDEIEEGAVLDAALIAGGDRLDPIAPHRIDLVVAAIVFDVNDTGTSSAMSRTTSARLRKPVCSARRRAISCCCPLSTIARSTVGEKPCSSTSRMMRVDAGPMP